MRTVAATLCFTCVLAASASRIAISECVQTPKTCVDASHPQMFTCVADSKSCPMGYQDIGHDQRCANTGIGCGGATRLKYFDIKQCVKIRSSTEVGRKFGLPKAPLAATYVGPEDFKGSREPLVSCVGPIKDHPRPTQSWCYVWDDWGDAFCGWRDGRFRPGDDKACNYWFIPQTAWARENLDTHEWQVCIRFENRGESGHGWRHFRIFVK